MRFYGNKRIGTHAMLVFLEINNVSVEYEDEELIETIPGVAAGDVSAEELIAWIFEHINEK